MRPLPQIFSVSCTGSGCWIATSRSDRLFDTFNRRRLRAQDCLELLTVDDEVPIAPARQENGVWPTAN
jgi:hypothetical protein